MKLKFFRDWKILPKILTISFISVILIDAVILLYFLPLMEKRMLDGDKDDLKHVVDVAHSLLAEYNRQVEAELMPMYEARVRASLDIRSLRYGEKEYFWINDLTPKMIMHPIKPELEGTSLTDFRDVHGTYLFKEFVRVCKEKGGGFVEYMWPKPGESVPVPKISYVRLFEPWGWVIGSGIYVDDVKAEMKRLQEQVLIGTLLFFAVTLSLAAAVGAGITRPVKKVIAGLREISDGREDTALTERIAITSTDEIGELIREFNRLLESISRVATFKRVIDEDDSLEDVYLRLGDVFTGELGFRECTIYEVRNGGNTMETAYPLVQSESGFPCNPEILGNCDLCKTKRTGHVVTSLDFPRICKQFNVSSGLGHYCIPLTIGDGVIAVIQFLFVPSAPGESGGEPIAGRISRAQQYIKGSLSVIEAKRLMKKLHDSALKDPLTSLHNRRFLNECLDKMVAGTLRRGKGVGLIMCDLDYFKQVNDMHGHDAGDAVLRDTAEILRTSVRDADLVVRFGGEEFLVLLLDIEAGTAATVGEKIRKQVETATFKIPGGTLKKTISLGTSEFPQNSENIWQAIKFADVALYKAKEGGRNRTVSFTSEMWQESQY
jgi:diguanylate cyclase (GGDEF)-like protein